MTPISAFAADRGDNRMRLDRVVRRRLGFTAGLSRTRIQDLIESGAVTVNGATVRRPASRVNQGDLVALAGVVARARARPVAEPLPLDVLYEDDHLLVVDKPPGMVSHPAYRHATGTLLHGLLWHARDWPAGRQPFLAGRLDKLTSGIVVVAKAPAMHTALVRLLRAPGAEKLYLAVVQARVPSASGVLAHRLMRDPVDRRRVMASTWQGQESETRYRVLARTRGRRAGLTLVACRLVSGRMHQVRVHLQAAGWPLVGDPAYGASLGERPVEETLRMAVSSFPRQALHAWRVRFAHPVTGVPVQVTAPVPDDLQALFAAMGIDPDALK